MSGKTQSPNKRPGTITRELGEQEPKAEQMALARPLLLEPPFTLRDQTTLSEAKQGRIL